MRSRKDIGPDPDGPPPPWATPLERLLKERGIRGVHLARMTRICPQSMQRYIKGTSTIPDDRRAAICRVLGLTDEELSMPHRGPARLREPWQLNAVVVRRALARRGWSVAELARRVGAPRQTLWADLEGMHTPEETLLVAIAQALGFKSTRRLRQEREADVQP